jgi:hypothetical protein
MSSSPTAQVALERGVSPADRGSSPTIREGVGDC